MKKFKQFLNDYSKKAPVLEAKNVYAVNFTFRDLKKIIQLEDSPNDYIDQLTTIMKLSNSKGGATINEMIFNGWEKQIKKYTKDIILIEKLSNRFINGDKSETIIEIYKTFPDDKEWIKELNTNSNKINKELKTPLEELFLALGKKEWI